MLPPPPLPDCAGSALFLDLDGTVIDFAPHPADVTVEPGLPALLERLERHLDGALAPLSGRPLEQVDLLLRRPRGAAGGSHGVEIRRADGTMLADSAHLADGLRDLAAAARRLAADLPGVLVEVKPGGLALHYRRTPASADAVRGVAIALLEQAGPGYMVQAGDHVMELKPAHADKGTAVAALMETAPFTGRVPWVVGDDLTDEHAFEEAHRRHGLAVLVGSRRPSVADYALATPSAARSWLAALADACCGAAA